MSEIIRFQNVHYAYSPNQPVLQDITLSITPGEFVALIGGNGSGKTTLAKHCNGLYQPVSGTVTINGKDTKGCSVAELATQVAYCYQNPDHQIFQTTVWEEVAFGPKNLGLDERQIAERVDEALRSVGLQHLQGEEPYFAGKGMRQKIAVASILAMKPQVIVLDEPTTGLDHRGMMEMMSLISRLHQEGHTILAITHDMRLVAEYAKRVIVLHEGRIIADGTPQAVFAKQEILATAQVEPPAVCRFALSVGLAQPLPLTLSDLQKRVAKELTE